MTEGGIKKLEKMIEEILRKKYGYRGEIRVSLIGLRVSHIGSSSKCIVYECCDERKKRNIYISRDLNNIATKLIVDSVLDFVLKNYGDIIRRIIEKKLEIIYEDNEVFKKILSDPEIKVKVLLGGIEVCKNVLYIKWDLYTTYIELSNETHLVKFNIAPKNIGDEEISESKIIQESEEVIIYRENYTGSYEDAIKFLKTIERALKVAQIRKI